MPHIIVLHALIASAMDAYDYTACFALGGWPSANLQPLSQHICSVSSAACGSAAHLLCLNTSIHIHTLKAHVPGHLWLGCATFGSVPNASSCQCQRRIAPDPVCSAELSARRGANEPRTYSPCTEQAQSTQSVQLTQRQPRTRRAAGRRRSRRCLPRCLRLHLALRPEFLHTRTSTSGNVQPTKNPTYARMPAKRSDCFVATSGTPRMQGTVR